jgi:ElaB/YqjD/DUF883 family membrane-anchored ribosome-binding protein
MDQGSDEIRQDMSEILRTRAAMAEKLELLEERIQDTVEEAKANVMDIMDNVKDTAEELVDRAVRTFDPIHHVNQHPWLTLGTAVLIGYAVGKLGDRLTNDSGYAREPGYTPEPLLTGTVSEKLSGIPREMIDDVTGQMVNELDHIKDAVVVAGRTFLREIAKQAIATLAESLETAGRHSPNSNGELGCER